MINTLEPLVSFRFRLQYSRAYVRIIYEKTKGENFCSFPSCHCLALHGFIVFFLVNFKYINKITRVSLLVVNLFIKLSTTSFSSIDTARHLATPIKSDVQEISTIEWQELKNRFPSFFVHKELLGR